MDSRQAAPARKFFREEGKDPYQAAPLHPLLVHLKDGSRTFLVGGEMPLTGGDNRWFWLVEQSGHRAKILLFVATGCVHIDQNATGGYADIQTEWQAAGFRLIRTYKWNGRMYILRDERKAPPR